MIPTNPCRLIPGCPNGNHTAINPIGPFHQEEQSLAHDLGHLRPGSRYSPATFRHLAESWWSAEAGRWWHYKKHISLPTATNSKMTSSVNSPQPEPNKVATRKQPSRAAKVAPLVSAGTTSSRVAKPKQGKTPAEKRKETIALKKAMLLLNEGDGATRGAYVFPLDNIWARCSTEEMSVARAQQERVDFLERLDKQVLTQLEELRGKGVKLQAVANAEPVQKHT